MAKLDVSLHLNTKVLYLKKSFYKNVNQMWLGATNQSSSLVVQLQKLPKAGTAIAFGLSPFLASLPLSQIHLNDIKIPFREFKMGRGRRKGGGRRNCRPVLEPQHAVMLMSIVMVLSILCKNSMLKVRIAWDASLKTFGGVHQDYEWFGYRFGHKRLLKNRGSTDFVNP